MLGAYPLAACMVKQKIQPHLCVSGLATGLLELTLVDTGKEV